jgi:hypothetical protein
MSAANCLAVSSKCSYLLQLEIQLIFFARHLNQKVAINICLGFSTILTVFVAEID